MGRKKMWSQQGGWVRGSSFVTQEEFSFTNTQSKGERESEDTKEGFSSLENQSREEGEKSDPKGRNCHDADKDHESGGPEGQVRVGKK